MRENTQTSTPGKWHYAPTGKVMQGYSQPYGIMQEGYENLVAGVFGDVKGGKEVAEANARLIAAAPTMYDFVKRYADGGDLSAKQIINDIHG